MLTINNVLGVLRACQRGIGIAMLPDYLVEENGGLVQLFGDIRHPRARRLFRLSGRTEIGRAGAGVSRLPGRQSAALAFLRCDVCANPVRSPQSRMAGMRPFVLFAQIARGILRLAVGGRLPILPDRNRTPAAVPLWKVIVGPRADKLQPDPQGSGFFFGMHRDGGGPGGRQFPKLLRRVKPLV